MPPPNTLSCFTSQISPMRRVYIWSTARCLSLCSVWGVAWCLF